MRWSFSTSFPLLGMAAALMLGVSACDNAGSPGTPLLTPAEAGDVGEQLAYDAEDEIAGATASGALDASAAAVASANAGIRVQCAPTRSPASPADADGDGVPDSVRLDFTGCVISWPLETDTVRGTIDIVDPTAMVADHSVKRIFTNLARVRLFTLSGKWTSETRNGIRRSSRDKTTLENVETNLRTDYVYRDGSTASHVKTWTSTFTADVAGSIAADQPLPSGTWTLGGTSSWTRGTRTYSLTVTTNPALHYDATCTAAPRFDAGTLTAVVTRGGRTMTVSLTFTACGVYTVTRS